MPRETWGRAPEWADVGSSVISTAYGIGTDDDEAPRARPALSPRLDDRPRDRRARGADRARPRRRGRARRRRADGATDRPRRPRARARGRSRAGRDAQSPLSRRGGPRRRRADVGLRGAGGTVRGARAGRRPSALPRRPAYSGGAARLARG